ATSTGPGSEPSDVSTCGARTAHNPTKATMPIIGHSKVSASFDAHAEAETAGFASFAGTPVSASFAVASAPRGMETSVSSASDSRSISAKAVAMVELPVVIPAASALHARGGYGLALLQADREF